MHYQPKQDLLNDRIILVTGASDGIGREAAMTYARYGATVILLGRNEEKLRQVASHINEETGRQPQWFILDLLTCTSEDCQQLAQRITVTETYQNKTTTKDTISVAPAQDIYVTIPTDAQISDITTDIQCPQSTSAPVAVGEVLGTVTLSLHSDTLATVDLTAQQQVSTTTDAEREAQAAQTRNQIFKTVGIIIGILILLFLTVFCV